MASGTIRQEYTPQIYYASEDVSRSGSSVATSTTGASLTLGSGTWLVLGVWVFVAASNYNQTRNMDICLMVDGVSQTGQRVASALAGWARLQCFAIVTVESSSTVTVAGAANVAQSGTDSSYIYAIKLA